MKKAIEKAQEAYRQAQKNADNKTCELLEADTFKPKDVKDRLKEFEAENEFERKQERAYEDMIIRNSWS